MFRVKEEKKNCNFKNEAWSLLYEDNLRVQSLRSSV